MALIYIVEDDVNIREIECIALRNSGHTVCDFETATEFYKKVAEKKPDLAILDIMLPVEDGYQIVKHLRQNASSKKIPVIMVTAKATEIDMIKGLEIGADDYIKKPFSVMELITRVKAVLRRTMDFDEGQNLVIGEVRLDSERHLVYVEDEVCELTYKEYELLKLLMKKSGVVISREVIMQKVWGTDFEGESRTLDMHIRTLRKKLKDSGNRIKTVRNVGYVME